jgi:hypothetical protein
MRSILMMVLLAAGCTAPDMRNRDRDALASEIAGRNAGPPQDCVDTQSTASLRPVDESTIRLDDGGTLYVNHLAAACPGLRAMDTLIVEPHGSQYCRGDHIRSVPVGGGIPGPACFLGQFTPYRKAR